MGMCSYSSNIFIDKASIYFRQLYLLRVHAWSRLCAIWQGAHSTPVLSSTWSKIHKIGIIMFPLLSPFPILSSLVTRMIASNNDTDLKYESTFIGIYTSTFALVQYLYVNFTVKYSYGQSQYSTTRDSKCLVLVTQIAKVFDMNPTLGCSSPSQVETFSMSETLTLSQVYLFVSRKWMLSLTHN